MTTIAVKFTKLQLDEACHKLSILRDEPDLQDSYEVTAAEALAVSDAFHAAQPGFVEFPRKFADVLVGELENTLEIDQDNLELAEDRMAHLAGMSSTRNIIAKIKAAAGLE